MLELLNVPAIAVERNASTKPLRRRLTHRSLQSFSDGINWCQNSQTQVRLPAPIRLPTTTRCEDRSHDQRGLANPARLRQGNHTRPGKWAETNLRYALTCDPYLGMPRRPASSTPLEKVRSFQIDQNLYDAISAKHGADAAMAWIRNALLFLAQVEAVRLRGEQVETEWKLRHRF
jgi:hypothetical protein